ncbi:hypothetical protein A6F68_00533 [Tsuneonella dongtanensis]|uniref:Uncharacterized protein n=1 Tax=Tsuneonella dongtanensis TaxID=692370 RepID=A0A1B2AAG3_9SPHN|nr:hypothetical protein [Tsuneonella dongtanensis]ANY19068.1 hypothetical protein A6F68_00533 [Tsuneonella dongtanensis]
MALGLFAKVRASNAADRERRKRTDAMMADIFRNRPGRHRRRPPEAGMPIPAVPPRGPRPKQGGAEAPLEFGD